MYDVLVPFAFCCLSLFFFKQKTAYELRISDWSSDVCSSDLPAAPPDVENLVLMMNLLLPPLLGMQTIELLPAAQEGAQALPVSELVNLPDNKQIGRASCRERVCQYV